MAQIEALLAEKASRTPVQQKIDSQLIYMQKMARGEAIAGRTVTWLAIDVPYTEGNRLTIDVRATVSDALLQQLREMGVEIVSAEPAYGSLRLRTTLDTVEAIAALPEVSFVQPKQEAITSGFGGALQPQKRFDRAAFSAAVQHALGNQEAVTSIGTRTSEGDVTHRADAARSTFGVNGTGVKIGVLSNGVTNLASSQALGDLGTVTVLPGQAGSGDEGTAMLEIVHDLAPGAQLFFATAFNGIASFAQNIRDLRAAGCDIIVDDAGYFVETPFQDGQAGSVVSSTNGGVVIQAVKDVTADGALYFSSAGNSGNLDAGTSGTWEGNFVDGGAAGLPISAIEPGRLHSFGAQTFDTLTKPGSLNNLYWSDPLGGSANDYDLFRLNSTGTTVLDASTDFQDGTQDPYEYLSAGSVNDRLVIVKFSGSARFLHLATNRGRLSIATAGQTHGHAATSAPNSFGVAATPAAAPGPYPGAFNSSNVVETFSSDGPRRIFFNNNGTAITPGNVSSTGGQLLNKPDMTAADKVSVTGVGGFGSPFSGTSASAPHAAAIAALVKSKNLSLTASQIKTALINSAIDIQASGTDRNSGVGIVMADTAVQSANTPPTLSAIPVTPTRQNTAVTVGFTVGDAESGASSVTAIGVSSNTALVPNANLVFGGSGSSRTLTMTPASNQFGATTITVTVSDGSLTTSASFVLTVTTGGTNPVVPWDLNGDRKVDLIWREMQTGDVALWVLDGTRVAVSELLSSRVPLPWQIVGSGDLNSDGFGDLVWRHTQTGDVAVWLTRDRRVLDAPIVAAGVPLAWQIAGVGDVDGDGKADLIWRHTQAGHVAVWLMDGVTVRQGPVLASGVPLAWQIVAVGDLDGDGQADLIWRDSQTGDVAVWLMNGVRVKQGPVVASGVPLGWQIAGVGDVDGDGKADLVWRHAQTGDVAAWLMNGVTVKQGPVVAAGVPLAWQIAGVGDVDGDGKGDLIWRHTQGGHVAVWLMDGVTVKQGPVLAAGVPLAWQIQR